ncbi:MAG: carbohydrate binding family 9 domain-containing protein [Acidobacteria bacterium]|nr:carbohydrate binding family 9 domain-containing protein [Acidobacteriota bacterium]
MFFLVLAIGGSCIPSFAQQSPQDRQAASSRKAVTAVRTTLSIKLDGDLSDAAWENAASADQFVQSEPYEGTPATEKTDVRLLYDAENLYIGVYCYDSEPDNIIVTSLKEDFPPIDTDSFSVVLDTFFDARNGFLFVTNPQGAKRDAQFSDEGRNTNTDWDTVWDVRAQMNGDGWTAELVIPFKSLSFDPDRPEQVWGINFSRNIRRKNEVDYWSPVPRRYTISRVSLAGELRGLEGIERGRNLRIKPFVATSLNKIGDRDSWSSKLKAGVDSKYSLTTSLTLDLTANTDFSQVEVDEQQINITRFSLFFPEKREFFLENEGIFQFGDLPAERGPNRSRETQLFFSRRIGLSPQGEPLPIWGGARLSGQVGNYSLGLLNMQTKNAAGQPGNNFTVARVKRNILANSDIGAIFINRQASQGDDFHRSWGVDANFRFYQNLTFNSYLAQTFNDGVTGKNWTHKIAGEWRDNFTRFQVIYTDIEDNFIPEVGFTQRKNVRFVRTRVELHPRPRNNRFIREIRPHGYINYFVDQNNRTVAKEGHYAPFEVLFHNGSRFEVFYAPFFDRLDRPFQIRTNIALPAGDYLYGQWNIEADTDPSKILSALLVFAKGSFFSGDITTWESTLTFRPNYRFSWVNQFTRNRVELPQGNFTTTLWRSRFNYYFNTRMFLSALIQYNSDRRLVSSNIRFNFIHRPLSDLFLVYNEEREVSGVRRLDRAISIKYTHMIAF